MEDEIDLRPYFEGMVRHWRWILGATVLAALGALLVSLIMSPTYEATAYVFVLSTNPTEGPNPVVSPQTQLALLKSGAVAQSVIQSLDGKLTDEEKKKLLKEDAVKVQPDAADKSLFNVKAQADTAQESLDVVNAWVTAGAATINEAQDQALGISLPALEKTADDMAKGLQRAEENLNTRRRDLQMDVLYQQLARTQTLLNNQFAERENVKSALGQTGALRQQVLQGQVSVTGEMLLNLQSIATGTGSSYSVPSVSGGAYSVQSSPGSSYLVQPSQGTSLTRQQQLDQLDAVIAALNGRQHSLDTSIDSVTKQVETLQLQLNEKQVQLADLTRARDTVKADYMTAADRLRNAQLTHAVRQNPARAIPQAIPPDAPIWPKKTLIVAVAAVLGLIVSIASVFGVELFKQGAGQGQSAEGRGPSA